MNAETMVGLLTGEDAVLLGPREVSRAPRGLSASAALDALQIAAGTRVALSDHRPGGRKRLRRKALRLGLRIEREFVVLPTWHRAAFLVEDHDSTLRWLWATLATVPPGVARGAFVVDAAARGVPLIRLWGAIGLLVPGRLLIASRP